MMPFISLVIIIICVLVGVAFFTLFERKLLGYIQLRKGPNKVGPIGILQPFSDAIKLFSKEHIKPQLSNYLPFLLAPTLSLALALMVWCSMPSINNTISFELRTLFFLCCIGLGVYLLLAAGWRSNSKYALLGALRGVAQTISYEVSLVLILLSPLIFVSSYRWTDFLLYQKTGIIFWLIPLTCLLWFVSCLAETNRTPFDFAEGESELVSGYNTEYRRGGFALLILREYTSILLISFLIQTIFFSTTNEIINFYLFSVIAFLFVWTRGTLPRFRYDKHINLAWLKILPFSLSWLILICSLNF